MPSIRSGASYKPSSSSQKGYERDYGRSQSDTKGQGSVKDFHNSKLFNSEADDTIVIPALACYSTDGIIDGKEEYDSFNSRMEENNNPPPKQVPRPAPVDRSQNSNVKKKPQAQSKGKGKAQAPKPYSQGYRIPKIQQDAMENAFQMARTMMELQKKEEVRLRFQK
ncbi:hypothetical protein O181_104732 [Austropuccinia psidii MF-1]|uniref:Uncharacterized protein n=1 Tax=Austropuccinia psidii MF-1 TaxID=1389203 RepID=A0A9Q3JM97_9BASI|nr:hypothetical protein [Austropuccinia psidii MF-1]